MILSKISTAIAAACFIAVPAVALAEDSTLVLVMGGEAYDGPPKFAVTFDGKPLGEGAVAAAIDTAKVGRFADVADKTPYVQSFTFKIPEAEFKPDGTVDVAFTNEAYGGEGSNRDRNLYIASVSVNGRAVTASGLATRSSKGPEANAMLGEFLVLFDGTKDGVSSAPEGGWPEPSAIAAKVAPGSESVAPKGIGTPPKATAPEVKTASLEPQPEAAGGRCDLDQRYNVVGFNANSNDLTPRLIERLDQVAHAIGTRQCNVQITGYSSRQGSFATNALFAVERAQKALHYLQGAGVKFVAASATGVGATDQFGPDLRANRRVVITVTP